MARTHQTDKLKVLDWKTSLDLQIFQNPISLIAPGGSVNITFANAGNVVPYPMYSSEDFDHGQMVNHNQLKTGSHHSIFDKAQARRDAQLGQHQPNRVRLLGSGTVCPSMPWYSLLHSPRE